MPLAYDGATLRADQVRPADRVPAFLVFRLPGTLIPSRKLMVHHVGLPDERDLHNRCYVRDFGDPPPLTRRRAAAELAGLPQHLGEDGSLAEVEVLGGGQERHRPVRG